MNIKIKFKGNEYDLTKYVAPDSLALRMSIDSTFDTGAFIIPHIKDTAFTGLDMSRPLPRYADCEIEHEGAYYNMLIADSQLTKSGGTYEHVVNLISRSKLLQMQTLPDITLTQHSQDISLSSSMTNNATNTESNVEYWLDPIYFTEFKSAPSQQGIKLTNASKVLSMAASAVENDYINGTTLKQAARDYSITFSTTMLNAFATFQVRALFGAILVSEAYDSDCYAVVDMYVNGIKHAEIIRQRIQGGIAEMHGDWSGNRGPTGNITPSKPEVVRTIKHTTVSANETISFRARTEGKYKYRDFVQGTFERDSEIFLQKTAVYISVNHSDAFEHIRMDSWEEKKISLIEYPVNLSETSKSKLNSFVAPEMTLQSYDFWKAAVYTGSIVGAVPRLRYDRANNVDELSYDFYDDLEGLTQDFPGIQVYRKKTSLDGYAAKAELNADSILKNNKGGLLPSINRFVGLRAIGRGQHQMTTDNISIHTPYAIDKIYKVVVKGVPVRDSGGNILYPASREWDITDRVVIKEHYDILPVQADYRMQARRSRQKNINNMLYYIQGERDLHGLTATGKREPEFITEPGKNRALYEVVYCKAAEIAAEGITLKEAFEDNENAGLAQDKLTQVYIEYEPYISTRARIYKEDQSGFEKPVTLFFNENARVNDAFALGAYAQGEINRSSNTVLEVKGMCQLAQVPSVGSKNSDGYVLTETQIQFLANDTRVMYYGKYSKDFTVLSEFAGIKSEYRIWEVPKTNIVLSNRKEERKIYVSDTSLPVLIDTELYAHIIPRVDLLGNAPLCASFTTDTSDKKHLLNVDSAAYGNCISWTVRAHDNYSTGSQRHESSDGELYQIDTRYTDDFGRVNSFDLKFYRELTGVTDSELLNLYPEITSNITAAPIYQTGGEYLKDAREIFSYSVNHIFLSYKPDKIFIYNGFTKYHNRIRVQNETGQIKCAVADYVPSKAATLVDRGRIRAQQVTVVQNPLLPGVIVNTPHAGGQGFVFYHDQTGELLLFTKTTYSSAGIYFGELS